MRDPSTASYTPAYTLNAPITNDAVARVIQSSASEYSAGDLVLADLPFAEFATLTAEDIPFKIRAVLPNPFGWTGDDLALYLGPVGMTGLTAFSALYEIGKPKKGETIFVSSAAGAVGQMVGQIAKREGMRVIGSVGSDEKLEFITRELGFDAGFNYKIERAGEALKRLAPEGVDVYFDNVGGEQLDAALEAMNERGRIIACGMVGCSFPSFFFLLPSFALLRLAPFGSDTGQRLTAARSRSTTVTPRTGMASRTCFALLISDSPCVALLWPTRTLARRILRITRPKCTSGWPMRASRPSLTSAKDSRMRLRAC